MQTRIQLSEYPRNGWVEIETICAGGSTKPNAIRMRIIVNEGDYFSDFHARQIAYILNSYAELITEFRNQ